MLDLLGGRWKLPNPELPPELRGGGGCRNHTGPKPTLPHSYDGITDAQGLILLAGNHYILGSEVKN